MPGKDFWNKFVFKHQQKTDTEPDYNRK